MVKSQEGRVLEANRITISEMKKKRGLLLGGGNRQSYMPIMIL